VPLEVLAAASALDHFHAPPGDPWLATSGWRLGRAEQPATWSRSGVEHFASVSAQLAAAGLTVACTDRRVEVQLVCQTATEWVLLVDGQTASVREFDRDRRVVHWQNRFYRLQRGGPVTVETTAGDARRATGSGALTAPMPGRIVKVAVGEGTQVIQNQRLMVLEAMKMEHVIEAPHAGVIKELCVNEGEQVQGGKQLLTLGPSVE